MLSWNLWHSLFDLPFRWRLRKVLVPESLFEQFGTIELANIGLILWMGLCCLFPIIVIPVTVIISGMRLGWHSASVLARQYELERFSTLASTSLGTLEMMLEVGRICCTPLLSSDQNLFTVAIVTASTLTLILSFMAQSLNLLIVCGILIFVIAFIVYMDYRQTFIACFLIGILAGTTRERTIARLSFCVACVVMQVAVYSVPVIIVLVAAPYFPVRSVDNTPIVWLLTTGIAATVVPYLLREALIVYLWRTIKTHLNDDIPALKLKKS